MLQHYRISLSDAIDLHKNGCLTAKGLLLCFFRIRLKEGWSMSIRPKAIMKKLGLAASTFWCAIGKLRDEKEISWDDPKNVKITRLKTSKCIFDEDKNDLALSDILDNIQDLEQPPQILDEDSQILDEDSKILDEDSKILDEDSKILDEEPPEPITDKASITSTDLDTNSSQLFPNSLSGERVEKNFSSSVFEEEAPKKELDPDWQEFILKYGDRIPKGHEKPFTSFCRAEAEKLPKAPRLTISWAIKHFNELICLYKNQYGLDESSAVAVVQKKLEKLHEELPVAIANGLESGEIKTIDRAAKTVFPNIGGVGWMSYDEWIEASSTPGGIERYIEVKKSLKARIPKVFKGFGRQKKSL
jgi:hypothetical protein